MFDIDFKVLISRLLPHFLRKTTMAAWINCLLSPLTWLYDQFLSFRDEKLFEAMHNGQVFSLEFMLNYKFYNDGTLRRIYITDNEDVDSELFIFNVNEQEEEIYIYNAGEIPSDDIYLYNVSEGTGDGFIVWVPVALQFDIDYMIGLITKYKLAGTTFQIKTYN